MSTEGAQKLSLGIGRTGIWERVIVGESPNVSRLIHLLGVFPLCEASFVCLVEDPDRIRCANCLSSVWMEPHLSFMCASRWQFGQSATQLLYRSAPSEMSTLSVGMIMIWCTSRKAGLLEENPQRSHFPFARSLTYADKWILAYYASAAPGGISRLTVAKNLFNVPMSMIGSAAGAASLPFFSSLFSQGKIAESPPGSTVLCREFWRLRCWPAPGW
jgi:hypothetical protein